MAQAEHVNGGYRRRLKFQAGVEGYYPLIGFIVIMPIVWHWHKAFSALATSLPGHLLTLLSMIVGFTAAAVTVLFAAPSVPKLGELKNTPTADRLVVYYRWAINSGIAASILSIAVAVAVGDGTNPNLFEMTIPRLILALWISASCAALMCFYRSTSLLLLLLHDHWGTKK